MVTVRQLKRMESTEPMSPGKRDPSVTRPCELQTGRLRDRPGCMKAGIAKVPNTAAKADWALPAEGPGPGVQGPNPRAGQLECAQD